MKLQPGAQDGDKALLTVDPPNTYYEFDNRVVTSAAGKSKIGIHRDPGSYKVLLWGTISMRDSGISEALAVEDAAEFTAHIFRGLLQAHGITITGKARAQHGDYRFFDQPPPSTVLVATPPQVLAQHLSMPLLEDVRVTNKTSQNLHAELDLRLIGQLKGSGGSFEGGSAVLKQFLLQAGLKPDEFFLLDGSGLSRRDLITPAAMIQLLIYAARQPWGPAFQEALPVAGVDGSLAERFVNTPAGGLVHAKRHLVAVLARARPRERALRLWRDQHRKEICVFDFLQQSRPARKQNPGRDRSDCGVAGHAGRPTKACGPGHRSRG